MQLAHQGRYTILADSLVEFNLRSFRDDVGQRNWRWTAHPFTQSEALDLEKSSMSLLFR